MNQSGKSQTKWAVILALLLTFVLLVGVALASRTAITPTNISRTTPAAPTFVTPVADGSSFVNDGNVIVEFKNSDSDPKAITITTPSTVGGMAIADMYITVPADTGDRIVGPFDPSVFNNSDGSVYIDYNDITGVTVGVWRVDN